MRTTAAGTIRYIQSLRFDLDIETVLRTRRTVHTHNGSTAQHSTAHWCLYMENGGTHKEEENGESAFQKRLFNRLLLLLLLLVAVKYCARYTETTTTKTTTPVRYCTVQYGDIRGKFFSLLLREGGGGGVEKMRSFDQAFITARGRVLDLISRRASFGVSRPVVKRRP